jgi:Family of unknown function (DUF5681)
MDCDSAIYGDANINLQKDFIMTSNPSSNGDKGPNTSAEDYKVGPGRPPKEYRFPPGRSGNPKGRKPKESSIELDLKLALEQALNKKITLKQGETERIVTMAIAGIEQLVAQYATGDHRARRDLIALAERLGVDLIAGQHKAIREGVAEVARLDSSAYSLSAEVLERLSIQALNEIIRIEKELEAEKNNSKKTH